MADAQRNGVEIRAIDVLYSAWDCTLEKTGEDAAYPLAVRMGFRFIKGFSGEFGERIVAVRDEKQFGSLRDFVGRTGLSQSAVERLVQAGAMRSLEGNRRQALWNAREFVQDFADAENAHPALELVDREARPRLEALTKMEAIAWDFRTSFHSTAGHPLGPLRGILEANGLYNSAYIRSLPDKTRAQYAGMVICRQRPQTASGVLFMTLEDEAGLVNLVVWPKVYEMYRVVARTASFVGVSGMVQASEDGVVHLIVDALWVPKVGNGGTERVRKVGSRDFR